MLLQMKPLKKKIQDIIYKTNQKLIFNQQSGIPFGGSSWSPQKLYASKIH